MRKGAFVVLVALAVLAAAACQNTTGPSPVSPMSTKPVSAPASAGSDSGAKIGIEGLMGTWQATKALGSNALKPDSQRDLIAEGGTVTLMLEENSQAIGYGKVVPPGKYTITVTMPGTAPGTDTGYWYFGPAWQEQYKGQYQMDFYPARLLPDIEYGEIPAFLVSLSGSTLKLWDSGLTFLPFDFGWNDPGNTCLQFEFIRK